MKKNNFICPLCSSNDFTTSLNVQLQDPISKIYTTREKIRTCKDCGLILYEHPTRKWEGGFFDEATGTLTYYLTNSDVKQGIADYIKLKRLLPESNIKVPIALTKTVVSKNKVNKTEDIYYYKSSLKGVEVLT